MLSLKDTAACLGMTGTISVLDDFYGFIDPTLPPDPTGATVSVSLLRELNLLQGEYFHVNIIRVGSDQFTSSELDEVDYSVYRIRNIYATRGIGVGRVEHYVITTAEANGLDSPTKKSQLRKLTNEWTVPNNGIDFFLVHNMNIPSGPGILLGYSNVNGPCGDKSPGILQLSGSTGGLWGSEQTSRTAAHELGHYMSLRHKNKVPTNLMCQSGNASSIRNSVNLTSDQEDDVRDHCFVTDWC
ncbi:MAG: hypothetical protein R3E39_23150 [Anaerolineae bacterium]